MATKLTEIKIQETDNPTKIILWADAGLYETIDAIEGVAVVDYRSTYYEVLLDPRYNRDELLNDIIAQLSA